MREGLVKTFIIALYSVSVFVEGQELLQNPGMETVNFNNNWFCTGGCTLTSSNSSYSGLHSVRISERTNYVQGLAQDVQLVAGGRYNLTAYIKLLNTPTGAMFTNLKFIISCDNGNIRFGSDKFVEEGRWTKIGGINKISSGAENCKVKINVYASEVNYEVDQASLTVVPDEPNWKTQANLRIDQIRKSNITVSLKGVANQDGYTIELSQTKHKFPFGSAVSGKLIVDPDQAKYQTAFYENFEWAVLENDLKWKQLEPIQGQTDYTTALNALRNLTSRGIKVRGHNVFWGVEKNIQTWVTALNRTELLAAMDNHTQDLISKTKGLLEHWDVNNEDLHGHWYEVKTGNANITMQMFHDVRAVDPDVKLFLNDFAVIERTAAIPMRNQAKLLKEAGVPIYGVGIQSHIKDMNLDIPSIRGRLDAVAEVGLPIWITELSLSSTNVTLKAQALQDILTLYFSHPSIEGILLWSFWDGKIGEPENALFEGPNVTPNAAGRVYQEFFKTTWRTNTTRTLYGNDTFSVRGFKGEYKIIVKHLGQEVQSKLFVLGDFTKNITIDVGSTTGGTFR